MIYMQSDSSSPRVLQPVHADKPPAAMDLEKLQKAFPEHKFGWELLLGSWDKCVSECWEPVIKA
jgi:hypothetical protein